MPTPHNAAEKGQIAPVVLMPGDPLRAKFVADTYLEDVHLFTQVRNMFGFTGTYQGTRVSVMGSGMGMPSMAIYSWELFNHYDVDSIIRIGTAGGLAPQVQLRDIVIGQGACTDSNIPKSFGMPGTIAAIADYGLLRSAADACEKRGAAYHVGNIVSSDVFYSDPSVNQAWADMGVLAVEMEACALYLNAAKLRKHALAIATISDLPLTGVGLSAEDRQLSFTEMMEVALEVAVTRTREL